MNIVTSLFRSSLGKKYVMAITGLMLFGFVILHMLGNLQIFLGRDVINAYGFFLKSKPSLLWTARVGLLVVLVLHVVAAVKLSAENRRAKGERPSHYQAPAATYASRTMLMSGIIVFVFLIYHLLHFTVAIPAVNLLTPGPEFPDANFLELKDPDGRHDVFQMMVLGYSNVWVSGFYILGMVLLCMHLSHGVRSLFQSIGLRNKKFSRAIDRFALISAIVIFIGNCSIPVAILLGYGR